MFRILPRKKKVSLVLGCSFAGLVIIYCGDFRARSCLFNSVYGEFVGVLRWPCIEFMVAFESLMDS